MDAYVEHRFEFIPLDKTNEKIDFVISVIKSPESSTVGYSNKHNLWAYVWTSGLALSELVINMNMKQIQCLEIGAGCGLVSVACARKGATVKTTDFQPLALHLCEMNASKNLNNMNISFEVMNWYEKSPDTLQRKFDFVFGSDVLYMSRAVQPILDRVDETLNDTGIAVFVDPGRSNYMDFVEKAIDSGKFEAKFFEIPDFDTVIGRMKLCVFVMVKRISTTTTRWSTIIDVVLKLKQKYEEGSIVKSSSYGYVLQ